MKKGKKQNRSATPRSTQGKKLSVNDHYKGMPEFKQDSLKPYQKVVVNLLNEEAALKFFKLIGQPYTKKTRSIWFPQVEEDRYINKRYSDKKKTK